MARAFIHQGVWRLPPRLVVDAPAQKRATLRVSILAAAATLALAALHDDRPAAALVVAKPAAKVAQPEIVSLKVVDRVPSLAETASPFRRRAPAAETASLSLALENPPIRPAAIAAVEVVDGGMIRDGDAVYRLAGVVLPENGRQCRRLDGLAVSCADRADSYLQLLVKGRAIACQRMPQSGDGPLEANCRVGDSDLAEQLVRQGWAQAAENPEERFVVAQSAAKRQKLGIWRE
jgi:endonuclease YncB( thermonuclease family)